MAGLQSSGRKFGAVLSLIGLAITGGVSAQPSAVEDEPFQSRPVVMGREGVVSAPHYLAAKAAVEILAAGGNATDAAVASAAVASVVQPFTSGLGGIGWAAHYDAETGRVRQLEFSGRVPQGTEHAMLPKGPRRTDWHALEAEGNNLLGSLVPGVVAGWEALLEDSGTMSLARVVKPAIDYARNGFPVSHRLHSAMRRSRDKLAAWPASGAVYLRDGEAYAPGEILRQPQLADTLEEVAAGGSEAFYRGPLADRIAAFMQANGGTLTKQDLAGYEPRWYEPIAARYRGYRVVASPPPASDAVMLEALNILERFPKPGSVADPLYIHRSVEAAKLARSDRLAYFGDPEFVDEIPLERILSDDYARRQADRIGEQAHSGDPAPPDAGAHTIQLAVVDGKGNAVNLLQTVGYTFGNGVVAGDTGILMNSMLYFAPADPNAPNAPAPGKRIEMNPLTVMVFDPADHLVFMAGSPGGKTVMQTVRQMILNFVDFEMNVQQAVDAPRFLSAPDGRTVLLERQLLGLNETLVEQLEARGHTVEIIEAGLGSGQAIVIDPGTGAQMGGADWRAESVSLAN